MRTKNSIINIIVSILITAITSILSLISTNLILQNYGSDYNGLIATVMQIITVLLVLEGGITTASNFALYKPYVEKDYDTINKILSKTFKQFIKVGILLLLVGLVLSLVYPLVVKSNIDYLTIFMIMMMVTVSTSFNILFTTRLNVMFQTSQKEYIYNFLNFVSTVIMYAITIFLIYKKVNIVYVRAIVMLSTFLTGILTYITFRKVFPKANFKSNTKDVYINGAKDIVVQRITNIIYNTSPMLLMSSFLGTIYTSVYTVYNSVFNIIKTFMYSIVAAPSNGFGQLLVDNEKEKVYDKYLLYEFIVMITITCLLSSVLCIIIPFVALYTKSIVDIQYVSYPIAIMFAVNIFLELMHTPAGTIIGVSGNFKIARNIQLIACIVLVPALAIGAICFNIYGMLGALILTSIILAFQEILYTHRKIFKNKAWNFFKVMILNVIIIIVQFLISKLININFDNYLSFIITGIAIFILNSIIIISINSLVFKSKMKQLLEIILNLYKGYKLRKNDVKKNEEV